MVSLWLFRDRNIQSRTIFSPFSKCRTARRHAGDHHGSSFLNRVFSVDTSKNIYRRIPMTVNSLFTQSLQFINGLYFAKLKYFSLKSSYEYNFNIFRKHFSRRIHWALNCITQYQFQSPQLVPKVLTFPKYRQVIPILFEMSWRFLVICK